MRHDESLDTLLARILIAKHGGDAAFQGVERLSQRLKAGDTDVARLWVRVVQILLNTAPLTQPEPGEILDEPVRRAAKGGSGRREARGHL